MRFFFVRYKEIYNLTVVKENNVYTTVLDLSNVKK